MSTRSVIAKRMGDGWEGVHHHTDGYPTGLGSYLFRLLRRQYGGDVQKVLDYVLSHDGGWSHLYPAQLLETKGYSTETVPQCYCHGYFARRDKTEPGDKSGWQTSEHHGWDIEWVYVLDPSTRRMAVLKHTMRACPDYKSESWATEGKEGPCMALAGIVELYSPEPDWTPIECGPDLEWCSHYRCVHGAHGCEPDCPYCKGTGRPNEPPGTVFLYNAKPSWVDEYLPRVTDSIGPRSAP